MAHEKFRLQLLHGVEDDADDDQQPGAGDDEQILFGDVADQERQDGDDSQKDRADERDALQDAVQIVLGPLARANARDKAALLL